MNERHNWADPNNSDDREIVWTVEATLKAEADKVIQKYQAGMLTFDEFVSKLQELQQG